MRAKGAGDTVAEDQVRSVCNVCRPRFACFNLASGAAAGARSATLLVLLHALESLFKLRDQRSLAGLRDRRGP